MAFPAPVLVICPGIHGPELTQGFLSALEAELAIAAGHAPNLPAPAACWTLPAALPPYSPHHVQTFVESQWRAQAPAVGTPLIWIGFSAGVVGAIASARQWQRQGGRVRCFIALDGWGVPLGRAFPCYRLSHDRFTALSCEALGPSQGYFYASPAVEHRQLWQSPDTAQGQWLGARLGQRATGDRGTASEILAQLILQPQPGFPRL